MGELQCKQRHRQGQGEKATSGQKVSRSAAKANERSLWESCRQRRYLTASYPFVLHYCPAGLYCCPPPPPPLAAPPGRSATARCGWPSCRPHARCPLQGATQARLISHSCSCNQPFMLAGRQSAAIMLASCTLSLCRGGSADDSRFSLCRCICRWDSSFSRSGNQTVMQAGTMPASCALSSAGAAAAQTGQTQEAVQCGEGWVVRSGAATLATASLRCSFPISTLATEASAHLGCPAAVPRGGLRAPAAAPPGCSPALRPLAPAACQQVSGRKHEEQRSGHVRTAADNQSAISPPAHPPAYAPATTPPLRLPAHLPACQPAC